MEGDEALLGFITSNKQALGQYLNTKFKPMYGFDFAGIGAWLDRIRLKGKYPMYTAQKHVVGAIARGLSISKQHPADRFDGDGENADGWVGCRQHRVWTCEGAGERHAPGSSGADRRAAAPDRQVETGTRQHCTQGGH